MYLNLAWNDMERRKKKMYLNFFAVVTQAKHHRCDIILCAAIKCRMWVMAGSFPGQEVVSQVGAEGGGAHWSYSLCSYYQIFSEQKRLSSLIP